jgi:hypothetical protein
MKVAILLCGQMRRYTDPEVLHSLHNFFALFGAVDVFVSTWSDRGVSYNHGNVRWRGDEGDTITEASLRSLYPQIRACAIHVLREWEAGLSGCRKQMYEEGFEWNGMKINGTVVPQLFGIWDANRLRREYEATTGAQYDVVIRCRPDAQFINHSKSLYESLHSNTIYAINNRGSGTFYPQRIYDIFFYGTSEAMNQLCDAYTNLEALVNHPWQNGLHSWDACRCLYIQARFFGGAAVVDLPLDVCKVVR